MAGLLAGCMVRDHMIYESQKSLPNNHNSVLRFRSLALSDVLSIPFKRVQMMKCLHPWRNAVADQISYSIKANGTARLRSAISADGSVNERFIAPPDLVRQMAAMCRPIRFGEEISFDDSDVPTISTIPMPKLMTALRWPNAPEFIWRSGRVLRVTLDLTEAYCSVYDPDPSSPITRASITGNELIAELSGSASRDEVVARACKLLGIRRSMLPPPGVLYPDIVEQPYAKILPIEEEVRQRFIMWASEHHNVYSLGRFATWRPGLLMDDVVDDVRVIKGLINGAPPYRHKLR